jgi:hypothetical protein
LGEFRVGEGKVGLDIHREPGDAFYGERMGFFTGPGG